MSQLKRINWNFIESLYRAGGLSNREVARQYSVRHLDSIEFRPSVTEAGIRRRAQRHGWRRDLSGKVHARTRSKLLQDSLRAREGLYQVQPENDILEAAAETRAWVIRIEREDLRRLRELELDLIRRLKEEDDQVLVGWYQGVAYDHQVKLGLLDRARVLRDLAMTMHKRILIERLAWGLDERTQSVGGGVDVYLNLKGENEKLE